ncbi:uncharacterized transposon-derived [Paramuricea clavata]|uniref:Uncharacterized transposon-derived n=1 Tax=Paramuricea clavata TaxID=317549 RepID=A0A6S7H4B1_PARCT|nr:uncharacterized transposon-derived [Paramuricea clavata]
MRRHFKQNCVIVGGIDQQWQMDLADMQSMQKFNDGYRYLLVCIDVFSKYAWVVPLKNKTGPTLVEAFKVILTSGRRPEKIMTDQGTEFLNRHFRALMKEDIELYNTYNETKASIVERLIRTLKTKMWRYFTAKKTMRYIDMLPNLVYSYNHSIHRSIKVRPVDVTAENEKQVWHTLYDGHSVRKAPKYRFRVGDQVRISKMKHTFEKGYLPNFSKEIFTVSKQIPRDPPVYKLKDYDDEELKGTFYDKELQKIIKQDDVYKVEKILKKRGRGNSVQYLVKCNASLDVFPNNKTTGYRVKLPQTVNLEGDWEVGMYSVSYPHTWYTLRNINADTHFYYDDGSGLYSTLELDYGFYGSVQEFIVDINKVLKKEIGDDGIYFTYSTRTGKVTCHLKKPGYKVFVGRRISLILGYAGKETIIDVAKGAAQSLRNRSVLFLINIRVLQHCGSTNGRECKCKADQNHSC